VECQAQLLQVVDALGSPRGLARRLNCRQQQRDQDRDDRDYDQPHSDASRTFCPL